MLVASITGAVISGNYIHDNDVGIYFVDSDNNTIDSNIIEDNNLNNIPLIEFDSYYLVLPNYVRKIVTNFADNCCLYKHLLIYEVLGIIPVFTNNGY